jgi:2-(3-amino-3-carboxypropyl)histidine synthase
MACMQVNLAESPYDFELDRVIDWVRQNNFKKVLLQSAPGLIRYLPEIGGYIKQMTGADTVVDGRGRFGACDVYTDLTGFEAVVHFGHTGFINTTYPILYIPAFSNIDASKLFHKILDALSNMEKVGLSASVQHIKTIPTLYEYLARNGKKPFMGQPGKRCLYSGQVVGCDYLSAIRIDSKVDCHVIIAGGEFHAIGLALSVFKPVLHVEPYAGSVEWVSKSKVDRINRVRGFAALTLQSAKKVALVDISLPGQHTSSLIEKLEVLLKHVKPSSQVNSFTTELLTDQFLLGLKELGYEVVVTAGCTRFATDDFDRSPIPIFEAREVYGLYLKGLNVDKGVFILQ